MLASWSNGNRQPCETIHEYLERFRPHSGGSKQVRGGLVWGQSCAQSVAWVVALAGLNFGSMIETQEPDGWDGGHAFFLGSAPGSI